MTRPVVAVPDLGGHSKSPRFPAGVKPVTPPGPPADACSYSAGVVLQISYGAPMRI